jgi:transketolase N-terminal domain/subunit
VPHLNVYHTYDYHFYPLLSTAVNSVAALNRINALTCCKSAEHGWPGGSFSCCEILLSLHLRTDASDVILSKGHAAAMQRVTMHIPAKCNSDFDFFLNS